MKIGVGLSIPEIVIRGGGAAAAFRQSGPTLDLAFVPLVSSGDSSAVQNYSLDLNFVSQQYQRGEQYMVWS